MPKGGAEAKELRFDWEFFRQSKKFIHVSDERKAFVKRKLDFYAQMKFTAFQTGYTKRKQWDKRYGRKPYALSQDTWDMQLWRFRVTDKIRIFAIFDETPADYVTCYVLWVDLTHRTGDK